MTPLFLFLCDYVHYFSLVVFIIFFNVQFPLMTLISLSDRCRQLGDDKRCSLEDLVLIEGFAHMLEGPLSAEVLWNQCLSLFLPESNFYHAYDL